VSEQLDSFNDELLKEYLLDSAEHIDTIEKIVVNYENKLSEDSVNGLFRAFHTIKGNSSLIGQSVVRDFCHTIESMVGEVRNGERTFTSTMADILLESLDILKAMLKEFGISSSKVTTDHSSVSEKIRAFMEGNVGKVEKAKISTVEIVIEDNEKIENTAKAESTATEIMTVKTTSKVAIFEMIETISNYILDDFIAHLRTFQQRGIEKYIFNFEKTKEIETGGSDVIITAIREIEMCKGKHFSFGISENISSAFQSDGLEEMILVKPNLKKALTSLGLL